MPYAKRKADWVNGTSNYVDESDLDAWEKALYELKRNAVDIRDYATLVEDSTDISTAFAAALADLPASPNSYDGGGGILIPPGTWRNSSPLTVSGKPVTIYMVGAVLKPVGATVGIFLRHRRSGIIGGTINGVLQTGTTSHGVQIGPRVGTYAATAEPCNACFIEGTEVWGAKGHGFFWEDGPRARFTQAVARSCTGSGFYMSETYTDNNHGSFDGTEALFNNEGYTVKYQAAPGAYQQSSIGHVFTNAKSFENAAVDANWRNGFRIETSGNVGNIFCEETAHAIPRERLWLTSTSESNEFRMLGATDIDQAFTDAAALTLNTVYGADTSWTHAWLANQLYARALRVTGAEMASRLAIIETASHAFQVLAEQNGSAPADVTLDFNKGTHTSFKANFGDGIRIGGVPYIYTGTGTPEAVVTAPIGSLFLRQDGGASTSLYVKTSGTGNVGWTAK